MKQASAFSAGLPAGTARFYPPANGFQEEWSTYQIYRLHTKHPHQNPPATATDKRYVPIYAIRPRSSQGGTNLSVSITKGFTGYFSQGFFSMGVCRMLPLITDGFKSCPGYFSDVVRYFKNPAPVCYFVVSTLTGTSCIFCGKGGDSAMNEKELLDMMVTKRIQILVQKIRSARTPAEQENCRLLMY